MAAQAGDTELVYLVGWFILLVKQEDRDGLALHMAPDKFRSKRSRPSVSDVKFVPIR